MKRTTIGLILSLLLLGFSVEVSAQRTIKSLNEGWRFTYGNASLPQEDFGSGTEYFNYLTKARSIHNEGPYAINFDASSWREVRLPHDWVVELDYAPEASHSHGYKQVGYEYPQTSVGWYRLEMEFSPQERGRHFAVQFDGIFRDSEVWFNGFYMGGEQSGYASSLYDITDYIDFGGPNCLVVRVDASLEEGWFYEGAGIYRDVWLHTYAPQHVAQWGVKVTPELSEDFSRARIAIHTRVKNESHQESRLSLRHTIRNSEGSIVAQSAQRGSKTLTLRPHDEGESESVLRLNAPQLWSPEEPNLYSLSTEVVCDGRVVDEYVTSFGLRRAEFSPEEGFLLNGRKVMLKGVNLHQDHAGVGVAIGEGVGEYRLLKLKEMGCNAIRTSHNPASPSLLELCDRLGVMVVEENRLVGINDMHLRLLERMIERDYNHPSIIAWSIGNEEWGIEGNELGERLARTLSDYCHLLDPSRPTTTGCSGGGEILKGVDVAGYNYLAQNPIDYYREQMPQRVAYGSEETSGCGTRGVYFVGQEESGRMPSINRTGLADGTLNVIGRGWKFYESRPWLGGLFYWTGLDYRGEPNPLKYPATGSEFGIMDYCGFPKDEYYYLRAMWRPEPLVHILPHWNLEGHEGEEVDVWVYTNCPEVELLQDGRSLGVRSVERGDYASWRVTYRAGELVARGLDGEEEIARTAVTTAGEVVGLDVELFEREDVVVADVVAKDAEGVFCPTADSNVEVVVDGYEIVGWGNGDPAFRYREVPASAQDRQMTIRLFSGAAQVILRPLSTERSVDFRLQ